MWHGFTTPVLMSVLALGGGGLMYAWLLRHRARALVVAQWRPPLDGKRAFDVVMVLMVRTSERLLGLISSGRLQAQLLLIVVVAFASALVPLLGQTMTEGRRVPMQSMQSSQLCGLQVRLARWVRLPKRSITGLRR